VLVRTGALGDVLLLRRAIASLNAAGRRICLVAPAPWGGALAGDGPSQVAAWLDADAADLAPLWARDAEPPDALRGALGLAPLAASAEAGAARHLLAFVVSRDPDLAANLARVAGRVIVQSPAPPPDVHASDWLARPLAALGVGIVRDVPALAFGAEDRSAAEPLATRLPRRFLALHPGSGSPRKNWPADRYAALAPALAGEEPFLVVSGPADAEAAGPLLRLPNAVKAAGLPLRVLGALLARCGLCVGNDSGVAHLAAAAGAPTLTLFGPTDPTQWAPVGTSVRVLRAEPLAELPVHAVAQAAATLWERGRRSGARGPRSR
jgi:hypothetical protein